MENQERGMGQQLESNPEMYAGNIAEKSGDHNVDVKRAAGLLKIVDILEQGN
jgi:hypothetical protein